MLLEASVEVHIWVDDVLNWARAVTIH